MPHRQPEIDIYVGLYCRPVHDTLQQAGSQSQAGRALSNGLTRGASSDTSVKGSLACTTCVSWKRKEAKYIRNILPSGARRAAAAATGWRASVCRSRRRSAAPCGRVAPAWAWARVGRYWTPSARWRALASTEKERLTQEHILCLQFCCARFSTCENNNKVDLYNAFPHFTAINARTQTKIERYKMYIT